MGVVDYFGGGFGVVSIKGDRWVFAQKLFNGLVVTRKRGKVHIKISVLLRCQAVCGADDSCPYP